MNPIASAEARIKQLCCLGLGGEAIMPAILAELHMLIPSYANCFSWSDAQGRMRNGLLENIDDVLPLMPFYYEHLHNRREEEVILSFGEAMRGRETVLTLDEMLKVDRRDYYRHDYYNLFCRPADFHSNVNLVVRERGVALGGLVLHRARRDPDFRFEDKRLLAALMPFIAHALTAAPVTDVPLVDSGREGFVIVDLPGQIRHLCPEARRLLILAAWPTAVARFRDTGMTLPAPVRQMCRRLAATFAGRESISAPPVYHHRNGLGGFSFRAHWLNNDGLHETAPEPATLIGIHIRYQEPLPVRAICRLRELPGLSRRQMQICLLLVENIANADIAGRMNMSTHTVVTHTRRIYDKLEVHDRAALVAKLTSASDVAMVKKVWPSK